MSRDRPPLTEFDVECSNKKLPSTNCSDCLSQTSVFTDPNSPTRYGCVTISLDQGQRETQEVEVLRFTRALFGLGQSPFILGGTIEYHLDQYKEKDLELVEEIRRNLYVVDIIGGGESVSEVKEFKRGAIQVFGEAKFELHKWHSSVPELESDDGVTKLSEQTYAKMQMRLPYLACFGTKARTCLVFGFQRKK